jgi:xanthine dehydrogenase accessory factor
MADPVPRLFGRGVTATAIVSGEPDVSAVALWPVPTMVVVGDGLIADALRDTAALLGWQCQVVGQVDESVALVDALQRSDAVVVLSHDRAVDGPVLAAALDSRVGYVGALGSRRTQEARRQWLTERGVTDTDQARIHGPAGLDIDAHTPAEISISIVAEILGTRSGSSGGALRARTGSIHSAAGVHAPPPRY